MFQVQTLNVNPILLKAKEIGFRVPPKVNVPLKVAERLVSLMDTWKMLTKDNWVLDAIQGYQIPFVGKPFQIHRPQEVVTYASTRWSGLQPSPIALSASQGGAELVADLLNTVEWMSHYPEVNTGDDSVRCLPCRSGNSLRTRGSWTPQEQKMHINCLELLTSELVVKSRSVRVGLLNSCSLHQQPEGGTVSSMLTSMARSIWLWALERDMILSAQGC